MRAYQFLPPAKHVHNMQSELFTLLLDFKMVTCRFFFGQNFWKTGGLTKKQEAVRSPKSREVFNSRRENHMYGCGSVRFVPEL